MEFETIGVKHYNGYTIKVSLSHNSDVLTRTDICTRLRIHLIEEGMGFLKVGNNAMLIKAPALLCLNQKETAVLEKGNISKVYSLIFHPEVVNAKLNFGDINDSSQELTDTDFKDRWCLYPFYTRNNNCPCMIMIDPITNKMISELLAAMEHELRIQRDTYWPCRSRSYLLELLFLLCRLYDNPAESLDGVVNGITDEVKDILLYLHSHYQSKITISELTKKYKTNKTTLNETFKKYTGLPVLTYLNDLRIKIACSMLRNTLLGISEIMVRVGYNDSTYFGRSFRRYTDCTPSDYRRINNWMHK